MLKPGLGRAANGHVRSDRIAVGHESCHRSTLAQAYDDPSLLVDRPIRGEQAPRRLVRHELSRLGTLSFSLAPTPAFSSRYT